MNENIPGSNKCSSSSKSSDSSDEESLEKPINWESSESDSEPELDCTNWDKNCIVYPKIEASKNIPGYHLMPSCENNPEKTPDKKIKLSYQFNTQLIEDSEIRKKWNENIELKNEKYEIITNPFKVCIIKNLLDNIELLNDLRKEFYTIDFNTRIMDLYEFSQSKDLNYLTDSNEQIRMIYEFLKNDLMKWIASITGFNLTHISATCSVYSVTDFLLLHDDQREDRMVAFILYLTDENMWKDSDGGSLQLFSKDQHDLPAEVVREIFPANNQLIFFPVTNDSYHQVAEITGLNKYRLSINGWFHVETPPIFKIPTYKPLENSLYNSNNQLNPKIAEINLNQWIQKYFLHSETINSIQMHIEEHSEISIGNYFLQEPFEEILAILQSNEIKWINVGPKNRYSYQIADLTHLPSKIANLLEVFQSTQMFNLLQDYTHLELNNENARMKFELQKWVPGSYALLTDYDWNAKKELDVLIHFGCKKNTDVIGARTQYVTLDDEVQEALITIEPKENCLNIVYRDSARFTKYFSKLSKCECFYTLICSYSE